MVDEDSGTHGTTTRWLEILEKFGDYKVEHRAGTHHGNADALSRRSPEPFEDCHDCAPLVINAIRDPDWRRRTRPHQSQPSISNTSREPEPPFDWVERQEADIDLRVIRRLLNDGHPKPAAESLTAYSADVKTLRSQYENLRIMDGVLRRRRLRPDKGHSPWQRIVPYQERKTIAKDLHAGLNGGNIGIRRTRWKVQQRFCWPGWARDVRLAVRPCECCARFKIPRPQHKGQLLPMCERESISPDLIQYLQKGTAILSRLSTSLPNGWKFGQ